ncbi:MAG: biotin transporter BioY [Anaerolineae bacterium]|jgi:biotin transport system substrate-specific component|nr:biotin transporter BioY [Anaerolineae bacterium]
MTVQGASFEVGSRHGTQLGSWAIQDVAVPLVGAYLIAVSAHTRLPLPGNPVPVTAQTFVVLLLGALLGPRRGLLSVGLYLAGGAAGLPFFAGGSMAGPSGGYLVGFAVAAILVGRLAELGWTQRPLAVIGALLLGNATIYLFGLPWLAKFVGWGAALPLGLYPFLVGDGIKLVCAACFLAASWELSPR